MKKTSLVSCILVILLLIASALLYLGNSGSIEKYTPYLANRALSVKDGRLVNEDGQYFDLKGVSTQNIFWLPQFVNREAFQTARDSWGVNTIRLPIPVATAQGYRYEKNRETIKKTLEKGIDAATKLGMYVIVDWATLYEHNPNLYRKEAKELLGYISEKYADADNIIYEICNEPNGVTGNWKNVKKYALELIPLIRRNDSNAVIIVGTPEYCSDLEEPTKDPITEYENLLYSFHFYAGAHGENYRQRVLAAIEAGLPMIVSEFSISTYESDGTDAPDMQNGNRWMALLEDYGIGKVFFSLSNVEQTNAMIRPDCKKTGGWDREDLTDTGKWLMDIYQDYAGKYRLTL